MAALRAGEQAVLASAGCKTMVELAAKLQSLKDASGAEALHDAVEAPRGIAAAAAANGPPALKPGLKPLRYEDCQEEPGEEWEWAGRAAGGETLCNLVLLLLYKQEGGACASAVGQESRQDKLETS